MQCVILAGGLGTRMRPWTVHLPKVLIPVHDVPFAHYQLTWLARHGVRDIVYCIGVKGDMVREYVGDGSAWGLHVEYSEDGDELVGTGGAIRRAFDRQLLHERFLLLYGDSFLPFDYRLLHAAHASTTHPAIMSVYRNQGRFDTGNVRYAGGVVQLYRKARSGEAVDPTLEFIDYGISLLTPGVVAERIPARQRVDLADVYHALSLAGELAGFEVRQRFYEIGSPAGLTDFANWIDEHPSFAAGCPAGAAV